MRAFIYGRVSTNDQKYSPDAQVNQCSAYCTSKDYDVAGIFIDEGVSGATPLAERPAGGEMLSRLEEADALVFAKLDRAFRDTVDCLVTVDDLREKGKAIHFLDLGIDTTTAAGELCLTMMGALAQFERRRISDRIKEALSVAKRRGVSLGAPAYGYRVDKESGARVLDLVEVQIIEEIRELGQCRLPANEIARMMNKAGKRTRSGKPFRHAQIQRILARPTAR